MGYPCHALPVNNHTHLQEAAVVVIWRILAAARFDRNGIVGVEVYRRVIVHIADYNMFYVPLLC
jgi:hypothetical protein